ncbi:Carbonic anhydrase 4 [Triplophysa tibetana]|uniref:Carbonic anhydrase 4 n=1 Tax=Triplophysa tibetana TaxID=1572043 RepID=A0A5A9P4J9_9TELE|nr:Carbonic anhydrase 4 [Triplophysa tibetana]
MAMNDEEYVCVLVFRLVLSDTSPERWSEVKADCGKGKTVSHQHSDEENQTGRASDAFQIQRLSERFRQQRHEQRSLRSGEYTQRTNKYLEEIWETHIKLFSFTFTGEQTEVRALNTPLMESSILWRYERQHNTQHRFVSNENVTLHKISLNQFILSEENMTNYYRYEGSLTTPGCTEVVVWTVFENPIPLDKEQLRAFSSLKFHDGKPMVGTFRPVQSRNGRMVYRSSGPAVLACTVLLFVSITTTLSLSHLN